MKKAKILCLHGFGTNAAFMKKQASDFMSILSNQAQLIFVDGPFQAPQSFVLDQKVIDMIEGKHRTWMPKYPKDYMKEKFMQEMDKLRIAFEQASDHYDGILGFSLGAVTVHFILKLRQQKLINWKILDGIKFTINLNGNHFQYSELTNWDQQLDIPSLHFISEEDFMYAKSIIHSTQYKNPLVITHSYGHKFPKLGVRQIKMLRSFIKKNLLQKQRKKFNYQVLTFSKL